MTVMTYLGPNEAETAVLLPRRCLQIVIGEARWTYKHSIKANDIHFNSSLSHNFVINIRQAIENNQSDNAILGIFGIVI